MRFRVIAFTILAAGIIAGGFAGRGMRRGFTLPGKTSASTVPSSAVEEGYVAAFDIVSNAYAGDLDYEKANQSAIQGMLSTLDPHSMYFSRAEFNRLQQDQDSRFYGIGVSILQHKDGVYIQSTVKDTPAARAGMKYGDRIVEVDGADARDWTSEQVSKKVRGEQPDTVRVKVERAGTASPISFTITRGSVPYPSIKDFFMLRPGTGYIGLTGGFQHTTDDELKEAISTLQKQGMRQIVLDLRGNPGGLLDQAINVASEFIERGKVIVSVKGRTEYSEPYIYKSKGASTEDYPLVLLINRGTASASEIVAGAIQDHGRGLLVGETSFGKGLVQRVFPMLFGTGLTLTTAHYYTPYGRLIQREYTSGSFYNYYVRHDETPAPVDKTRTANAEPSPSPNSTPPLGPPVKTAAGRVFYGGGGITPDIEIKQHPFTPERQQIAEAAFFYIREVVAGQIPALESFRVEKTDFNHDLKPGDMAVTDRLLEGFRGFLEKNPSYGLKNSQFEPEIEYAKLRLRFELVTAAYGADAGQRVLIEGDNQVMRALEALPDAKRLAESARIQDAGI